MPVSLCVSAAVCVSCTSFLRVCVCVFLFILSYSVFLFFFFSGFFVF